MKKKLKRLLTGMLTLATVFTALPASTVHASGTQYWTDAEEKAGYDIVNISLHFFLKDV